MEDNTNTILLEKRGAVAWVTLNRPRVLNAYNLQMRDALYETLGFIEQDTDIHVAVFRGAGERAFCAGADLTEFGTAPSQAIARRVRFERDVWARFLGIHKPLIAAIQGYCLGSGLEIALCCDIRIAAPDARFGLPETGLGMIPAAVGSQTLPRLVAVGAALKILLTGDMMGAHEARRLGLVNRVVPQKTLFQETQALAEEIAALQPAVVQAAKLTLVSGLEITLKEGCEMELRTALALATDLP